MKKQVIYHDDPYANPQPEASIPVLGKDWPPPAGEKPQQNTTQQQDSQAKADDIHFKRLRPEGGSEEKESKVGNKRQMQNDLRYTSVMKKDKNLKKKDAEEKINSVVNRSDNVLMKLKAVFPFDLFPTIVTIDANKVTIVDKTFFASETVTAILLEEITDIVVESNFFVACVRITYSHHPLKPLNYAIPNLPKKEALHAQEIIQGLLVLRLSEGIDLSKLQPDEITKELSKIGEPHENLPAL